MENCCIKGSQIQEKRWDVAGRACNKKELRIAPEWDFVVILEIKMHKRDFFRFIPGFQKICNYLACCVTSVCF